MLQAVAFVMFGQKSFISPYSSFGLGDLTPQNMPHAASRGGLELAVYEPNHINLQNPALLANSRLAIFESAAFFKNTKQTQDTMNASDSDGNIVGAFMAFPLAKFWSTSLGFNNFSKTSYFAQNITNIDNGNAKITNTNSGFGSLNQFHISNGIKVYKTFNLGFTATYLFGNIDYKNDLAVSPLTNIGYRFTNLTSYTNNSTISTFVFKGGAFYRGKLNDNYSYNFAATFTPSRKVNSDFQSYIEYFTNSAITPLYSKDTLFDGTDKVFIPKQIQGGFTIERNKKWLIGVDFSTQEWSKYKIGNKSETLKNNTTLIVGGEFTPDYQSTTNYFARCNYKAGFRYEKTPLFIAGTQLENIGINFGIELPTDKTRSFINLGLELGKRGTTTNNLIQENYFRVNLGMTLNDRWFLKRKIN